MCKIPFSVAIAVFCLTLAKETVAEEQNLNLTLFITESYFEIWAYGGSLPKIFYKEDGANLWILNRESEEDTGRVERRSAYDELGDIFVKIHERFNDYPDIDRIMIVPESNVLFSKTGEDKIINAAKKVVHAGFLIFHLSSCYDCESSKKQERFYELLEKILKKVPALKLDIDKEIIKVQHPRKWIGD